jgi:twitching motility protein PilT
LATLDKILDAMPGWNADAVTLTGGAVPQIHVNGQVRTLRQAIPEPQLIVYLREIADPASASVIEGGKSCDFLYRNHEFHVQFTGGGVTAVVFPSSAPAPAATAAAPAEAQAHGQAPVRAAAAATARLPGPARTVVDDSSPDNVRFPIDALFYEMIRRGASDLHISTGEPPYLRLHGEMVPLEGHPSLTPEAARELLWPICPERNRTEYDEVHDTDFAYQIDGLARFRCNFFMDRYGMGAVFRQIPTKIPTVEELGLSKAVVDLCWLSKGLVLVTGPTGSGKSTTLAALVDFINKNRADHIITIEDPIEFVHDNKRCLLNQREVAVHTGSFKRALRAALREDPDIVMVGEMRDLETVAIAIETAETGHLVFGTLHTTTAPSTVDRIIDQFPADRQQQIRMMLSECLKGVISQTLCKKVGGGRVAAFEVLLVNASISNLIREGKVFQIPSIMQTQKGIGNVTLNDALFSLVKAGTVDPKEAYLKSVDKVSLKSLFERHKIEFSMDVEKPV